MKNYIRIIYIYSRFKKKDKFGILNFVLSNLFVNLKFKWFVGMEFGIVWIFIMYVVEWKFMWRG